MLLPSSTLFTKQPTTKERKRVVTTSKVGHSAFNSSIAFSFLFIFIFILHFVGDLQ